MVIKKTISLIIILIILTLSIFYIHQKSFSHYDNFWQVNSLQTRQEIWANSFKLLTYHPLLGIGLADYKQDYRAFIDQLPGED